MFSTVKNRSADIYSTANGLSHSRDFEKIVMRTPGVLIGRVEIIPTFNPELLPNEPGDAPGAVTIMVIPRYDCETARRASARPSVSRYGLPLC